MTSFSEAAAFYPIPHDTRDQVVDDVQYWAERADLPAKWLLDRLALSTSKYHQWKDRYGKANEHHGQVPRDGWLEDWEKQAILDDHERHPLEGYRMGAELFEANVAAAPTSCNTYLSLDALRETESRLGRDDKALVDRARQSRVPRPS